MLLLLPMVAQAAPPPAEVADAPAQMQASLVALWRQARGPEGAALAPVLVVLELEEESVQDVLNALNPDAVVTARAQGLLQLELPPQELLELAWLPGVRRVRLPHLASAKEVMSEGAEAIFVDQDWREQGVTGEGVTVGVVDVGFAGLDRASPEELPASLELVGEAGGSSHGLAVVEVIHDVAPGAAARLYPFSTDVEFLEVLELAVEEGVDVINASIGFDNVWHADGTSPLAQAVDRVHGRGVVYVAAAGNEVGRYRAGTLSDADGDGYAELDGASEVTLVSVAGVAASLRWSEPFGEAAVDLDLELVDEGGLCDASAEPQDGEGYPYEVARCASPDGAVRARVRVSAGDPTGLTAWLYAPSGLGSQEPVTEAGTLTLPADAEGAIAVGAYDLETLELEPYSSQGPTDDGRLKPDLVAAGAVSTEVVGRLSFQGSSAAAPHVAGLAALILDRRRSARPSTVADLMREQAEDLGDPGPDTRFGAGAARAGELPGACGCVSVGPVGASATLSWIGVLWMLRRRSRRRLAQAVGILYTSATPRG